MTDNRAIFDTLRPWLDPQGFTPARIAALDAAIAASMASGDHKPVFDAARDWLDREGYTPRRINALDTALNARKLSVSVESPGWGDNVAPAVPAASTGLKSAEADDRYLPLFQRLAASTANPEVVKAMARSFAAHAPAYGQDASKPRIAEFVAQIANETGGFRVFEENLNYSAARLSQVWPSRFPRNPVGGQISAASIAHKPEQIANIVYARQKEGNTQPGDGWRYRGRGALQLTFRNNYRRFGQLLGIDLEGNPDLAADPATSVLIALAFFKAGNVNRYIDAGNFKAARGITNAGDPNYPNPIGLADVAALRAKALGALA